MDNGEFLTIHYLVTLEKSKNRYITQPIVTSNSEYDSATGGLPEGNSFLDQTLIHTLLAIP